MRVEHPTDRPNFTAVHGENWSVWYSYQTPIAYEVEGLPRRVSENVWSVTTGKHLNYLEPDKGARVPWETFAGEIANVMRSVVMTPTDPYYVVVHCPHHLEPVTIDHPHHGVAV